MARYQITDEQLAAIVKRLNTVTKSPLEPWTKNTDGTYTANTGNFNIDSAYGKVGLVRFVDGSAERVIITRGTKRELYEKIVAFIDGYNLGVAA